MLQMKRRQRRVCYIYHLILYTHLKNLSETKGVSENYSSWAFNENISGKSENVMENTHVIKKSIPQTKFAIGIPPTSFV